MPSIQTLIVLFAAFAASASTALKPMFQTAANHTVTGPTTFSTVITSDPTPLSENANLNNIEEPPHTLGGEIDNIDSVDLLECWENSARYEFGEFKCAGKRWYRKSNGLWHDPYDCWENCNPFVSGSIKNDPYKRLLKCERRVFWAECRTGYAPIITES
ncbi:hypothetical protein JX266_011560 [Neoarthrinium moseri]|uniref:uncharacterized protein n=1 Tax=Neoarthrinium moseri TaxID=1658444 RepID=UPI001FDEA299|nr:uncharacterized protein JN550_002623 [Neoarthrinium moseri]KAI1842275.1 hypothetical protein JX266_011560 [Neoarthrinium moseri]KAI1874044.1 hypothetical protein JN550_002623 [Neoarthrinium moseri]